MVVRLMSILLAMALAAGCAPKAVLIKGPQISMMAKTNFTSSEYDAGPLFLWDIGQNTLQTSGSSIAHVSYIDNGAIPLCWQLDSPVRIVQQWSIADNKRLITTTSKDVSLLTPPEEMRFLSAKDGSIRRWYASDEKAFVSVPAQLRLSDEALDTKSITITEKGVASDSKPQTLTVAFPLGVAFAVKVQGGVLYSFPLYGSGSIKNGFILFSISTMPKTNVPSDSLWLLRIKNGKLTWTRCGDLSALGGSLISGQDPSFARVGSLLYFTHSHAKIGCIDTAAASPSVTVPDNINTLLAKLYSNGPTNTEGPLQAQLASDNGTLIIEYPDANWDSLYYAADASGTVLGNLHMDKTSITSADAKGKRGSSINISGSISFPSPDLWQ